LWSFSFLCKSLSKAWSSLPIALLENSTLCPNFCSSSCLSHVDRRVRKAVVSSLSSENKIFLYEVYLILCAYKFVYQLSYYLFFLCVMIVLIWTNNFRCYLPSWISDLQRVVTVFMLTCFLLWFILLPQECNI
jgi:hypothetical protein